MHALSLEVPFTEDEVHGTLTDLNGDKGAGWFYGGFLAVWLGCC